MKSLAAVVAIVLVGATSHAAAQQSGTAPFCLQNGNGARCVFGTMGECEAARGNTSSGQCMTRTDASGTTGLGDRRDGTTGAKLPDAIPRWPPERPR
jgi:hypothetical protein